MKRPTLAVLCYAFAAAAGHAQTGAQAGASSTDTPTAAQPSAPQTPSATPPPSPPPLPPMPPEMTVSERSVFFYDESFPPEAVEQRLSGTAVVRATVAADGRFVDVVVDTSSGSPILDEAAVRYAGSLGLRAGRPEASYTIKVRLPVQFVLDSLSTLPKKTCAEFNTDYAKYRGLKPGNEAADMPVFTLATGVIAAARIGDYAYITKLRSAREKTIETCAKSPGKTFLDVYARGLR